MEISDDSLNSKKPLKNKPRKYSYRLFLKSGVVFDGYEDTSDGGETYEKDYIIGDQHEWNPNLETGTFKILNDGEVVLAVSNHIFGGFHRIEVVKG
jgi:hypothetical protein